MVDAAVDAVAAGEALLVQEVAAAVGRAVTPADVLDHATTIAAAPLWPEFRPADLATMVRRLRQAAGHPPEGEVRNHGPAPTAAGAAAAGGWSAGGATALVRAVRATVRMPCYTAPGNGTGPRDNTASGRAAADAAAAAAPLANGTGPVAAGYALCGWRLRLPGGLVARVEADATLHGAVFTRFAGSSVGPLELAVSARPFVAGVGSCSCDGGRRACPEGGRRGA